MRKYTGIILILLTFIITHLFWSFEQSQNQFDVYRGRSQLIASLALVSLAWINYISTRHSSIDKIFDGLDKSYIYHKYLSILAIIFIWAHDLTLKLGRFGGGRPSRGAFLLEGVRRHEDFKGNIGRGAFGILTSGRHFASLSMYIFTILVIFFIIAYQLEYEKWKWIHKLLLIPYAFGLIHYYLDSDYGVFTTSAYSIWMNIINIIGILTAIYSIFIYEFTAFKYRYEVTNIREVAKDTFEITGKARGKDMKYKPGQFAFIKVLGRNKGFPSHPFTNSQPFKPGEIQFTIKVLGDHTDNMRKNLAVGDIIAAAGPHGRFDFRSGIKHQIWLAGGIGITPFRAFWQEDIPRDYNIDLFYAYNNEKEGPYIDELEGLKNKNNLKLHLIDSSKIGFLQAKNFEENLNKAEQYDVYFCGPVSMRKKIKNDLRSAGFKIRGFHYEFFQFK